MSLLVLPTITQENSLADGVISYIPNNNALAVFIYQLGGNIEIHGLYGSKVVITPYDPIAAELLLITDKGVELNAPACADFEGEALAMLYPESDTTAEPDDKGISLRDIDPKFIPSCVTSNAAMLETLNATINTLNALEGDIAHAAPQADIEDKITTIRWTLTVLSHQFQFTSGLLDHAEPYQELVALIQEHSGITWQPGWHSCEQDLIARLQKP
jgi:hypothetical protein